jgi:hypothetical protein
MVETAALFVPGPVLVAICNDALDEIAELRNVTTIFLSLDSYDPVIHRDPASLQPFFKLAQKILDESGGFLRQFLVDDKGCVLIAMWGVPSISYSNNAARALYFAVALNKLAKRELNLQTSIGVTTGTVFCGMVGHDTRRDYTGL